MRYATASAFRAALDERLKTECAKTGLSITRLRKRVAFELFLRRLVRIAPERWVLKGALALDFRIPTATRSTKDIDIGRGDSEEAAVEDLTSVQELALDDYFTYTVARTEAFGETDEFSAVRFNVRAELAGRTFESLVLDVAFVDPLPSRPEIVYSTRFLSFAGIDQVRIPSLPIHDHVAEKVHAYTRTDGDSRPSTRPKDLVDILLIASAEPLEAAKLRHGLVQTFATRDTHPLPDSLPAPPPAWTNPYDRLASEVPAGAGPARCVRARCGAPRSSPTRDRTRYLGQRDSNVAPLRA